MLRTLKKIFLTLIAFLYCSHLFSQEQFNITGTVTEHPKVKYAYLISFYKDVARVPIVNGAFQFQVQKIRDLDMRALVLSEDSLYSYEAYMKQKREGSDDGRVIMLENMNINIGFFVANAIINGGPLTKVLDQMFLTIKSGNYGSFFSTHNDSPVSVLFLKSLVTISKSGTLITIKECEHYFGMLTDRIKSSTAGLKLAENF